ncbi:MAG: hypothetical protein JKY56_11950 [Kofleriaceae bacterium]|nr:hypothetical protein [Kofleriaceae bacterium]
MSRTFVRLYAGVVLFLLSLGLTAFVFLHWGQSTFTDKDIEEGFGLGPILVAEALASSETPDEDLETIMAVYGYNFVRESIASLPPATARRINNGDYSVYLQRGDDHFLATRIDANTALVLNLGQFRQPSTSRYVVAIVIVLSILAAGLLTLLIPLGRQMKALQVAAENIADGNWKTSLEERGVPEQRALAKAFNLMSTRIGDQMEHQRQLFRALSHELRTPLARMRFRVELVQDCDSLRARAEVSDALDKDLSLINSLVDELLTHARLESGAAITRERLSVREELEAVISERVVSENISVSIDVDRDLLVDVNRKLFRRAMGNLLSNALTYASNSVRLEAILLDQGLQIDVIDDGPGIPAIAREKVFRAFERLEPESDDAGTGLGLAIVEGILTAHGGKASVANSESGCRMRTSWPLARDES